MIEQRPLWRITNIQDTSIILPNAGPVRAKRISFVLADGTPSYVEVPLDQATVQVVGHQIEEMARQHFALIGLQSETVVTPPQE